MRTFICSRNEGIPRMMGNEDVSKMRKVMVS